MNYRTRKTALAVGYLTAGIATAVLTAQLEGPWSFVAFGVGLAVMITLYVPLVRTRRPTATPPAKLRLDPWATAAAAARDLATDELISMHNDMTGYNNAGTSTELAAVLQPVIRDELTKRRIPLCQCGAPKSGGVHLITCEES